MKKPAALWIALVFSLRASRALADDTSLEGLLAEEVVTSVSRSAESAHDAPALTRSISAEEIRRYGMTTVAEALDFLGVGVHVEHALGRSELTLRGVAFTGDRGNHLLVLVDGHALNEPLIGDAAIDQRLGVPLEMIDHIELVLGPGSAIYGTNAMLGVVNVVTKTAKTMNGMHAVAEAGSIGTLRSTLTMGHTFDLLRKRAEFTAGITTYQQKSSIDVARQDLGVDPITGRPRTWGGTADDAYRASATGIRLRLVRDGLEISGRAAFNRWGDPLTLGDFDHPDTGNAERRGSLVISQRFALGHVGELTATAYGKGYDNHRRIVISRSEQCPFGRRVCDYRNHETSARFGADVRATFDWLHDGRVLTTAGTGTSMDRMNETSAAADHTTGVSLAPAASALDISSVWNVNAYAQQTLKPLSWLDLTAGGRVDWRKINDRDDEEHVFHPMFTPRLAGAVRPWTGGTVKVIYARAFRAPNPYEADASAATLIRAEALQPETSTSVEAIFEQRVDAQRFMVGAFRAQYLGIIHRHLLSDAESRAAFDAGLTPIRPGTRAPIYQFQPNDHFDSEGFNAALDGTLVGQKLHYGVMFTGTFARTENVERILAAPQWFGNARLAYDFGEKLPTAALATTFGGPAVADRAYDSGYRRITLSPPSLEVRATLTGDVPWVKGLSYRAIVSHQANPTTPFAIGPTLRATTGFERVALTPTQPWNALLGLQYDF